MRKKQPKWERTKTSSTVTLCHLPKLHAMVYQGPKSWQWRLAIAREGIALGDADSQRAAEQAAIARVKELLREIEAACPE